MTISHYIFMRSFGVSLLIMSLHTACDRSKITATKGANNTCKAKWKVVEAWIKPCLAGIDSSWK